MVRETEKSKKPKKKKTKMTRDERQDKSIERWMSKQHRATIEAVTGFGKTRIAIKVINLLRRNDRTRKVIVVVPTLQLQQQWREVLTEYSQADNTDVYVINSFVQMTKVKCSMLILDEIHRYAATTFSKVFLVCIYDFLLGLTATMSRLDKKHDILERYAPICDKVTMAECRKYGWISQMVEYNLSVEMSEQDHEMYSDLKLKFGQNFDKFAQDFETMKMCAGNVKPKAFTNATGVVYSEPPSVRYARRMGWKGPSVQEAYRTMIENETRPRGKKLPIWGDSNHPYHPERVNVYAINGLRYMREMKEYVHKMKTKIDVAERLIKAIPLKTITFAETTDVADDLANRFGKDAVVYHSNVKAGIEDGKRVTGAQKKRSALAKFKEGQVRLLITAKAVDEGADFPDVELGITLSRTSAPRQYVQRRGRVSRKHTFPDGREKRAMMINIFVKGTKDYDWLTKSQKADAGIIWVESVEEILENEGYLLSESGGDEVTHTHV